MSHVADSVTAAIKENVYPVLAMHARLSQAKSSSKPKHDCTLSSGNTSTVRMDEGRLPEDILCGSLLQASDQPDELTSASRMWAGTAPERITLLKAAGSRLHKTASAGYSSYMQVSGEERRELGRWQRRSENAGSTARLRTQDTIDKCSTCNRD